MSIESDPPRLHGSTMSRSCSGPRVPMLRCAGASATGSTRRPTARSSAGLGVVRQEARQPPVAPGVLAYDGVEVVGWAAVAPRSKLPFARSTKIPHVDELPVWSVWCIRVRPGHRGKGFSRAFLDGAVAYARSQGAPAVEGYPVDNRGKRSISPWPTSAPASSSQMPASPRLRTPARSRVVSPGGDAARHALNRFCKAPPSGSSAAGYAEIPGRRCSHHSTISRLTTQLTQLVTPIAWSRRLDRPLRLYRSPAQRLRRRSTSRL